MSEHGHVLDSFKTGLPENFNIDEYGDEICKLFLESAKRYNSTRESQSTARIKFEFNPASVDDNVFDCRWLPQLPLETVSQDEKLKIENLYVTLVQNGFIIFN